MNDKHKKKKKWVRFRHEVVRRIAYLLLSPYIRWKYRIKVEKFREPKKRPYLILMNHQTAFDQFFVGMAIPRRIYYVASEDLFSNGWISKLLRWLVAPIPIQKSKSDFRAVIQCLRVAKEGASVALAPEGNRTYSGRTGYIKPSTASFVKAMHLPLLFFRIEGGYGVQPRWSDVCRKGRMHAYVSSVMEPEEYEAISDEALFERIQKELAVDEATADGEYRHKKAAEYLERAMYVCPDCGFSTWESHRDLISCLGCGRTVRYLPTKELEGVGKPFPFRFVADWYEYQNEKIHSTDPFLYTKEALYRENVRLFEVELYKRKHKITDQAVIALYGDRMTLFVDKTELVLSFSSIRAMSVLGRNKLNVYIKDKLYQIKGTKRFNALKYMNFYYHFVNITTGDKNGKFLGL